MAHDHASESEQASDSPSGQGKIHSTGWNRVVVLFLASGLAFAIGNFLALDVLSTIRVKLGHRDVVISVAVGLVLALVSFIVVDRILTVTEAARAQERLRSTEGNKTT